jgi:hypothetical protein
VYTQTTDTSWTLAAAPNRYRKSHVDITAAAAAGPYDFRTCRMHGTVAANGVSIVVDDGVDKCNPAIVSSERFFHENDLTFPYTVDTAANKNSGVATVTVNDGGSLYVVGDVLTIVGGTGTAAQIKVLTVNSGAVLTFEPTPFEVIGDYSVTPGTTAIATTGHTGDCTVDLTYTVVTQTLTINPPAAEEFTDNEELYFERPRYVEVLMTEYAAPTPSATLSLGQYCRVFRIYDKGQQEQQVVRVNGQGAVWVRSSNQLQEIVQVVEV